MSDDRNEAAQEQGIVGVLERIAEKTEPTDG